MELILHIISIMLHITYMYKCDFCFINTMYYFFNKRQLILCYSTLINTLDILKALLHDQFNLIKPNLVYYILFQKIRTLLLSLLLRHNLLMVVAVNVYII